MYLYYKKLNICLSLFLVALLFNFCSSDNESNKNSIKCHCDSTYFNLDNINEKEFLCYKGNKCYKLVVKGKDCKMTEHYIEKPNYSYQRIVTKGEQIIDSISNCVVLNQVDTNLFIKYIGPKVDSLNIYTLSNSNERTEIKHSLSNDFVLSANVFVNDTNKIVVDAFFSRYLDIGDKKGNVLTLRTINLPPFKLLKETSFDKLLLQTVDCMKNKSR
jgi:hypothetical protein